MQTSGYTCAKCDFRTDWANEMEGHIRNVHGWPTPPSVHSTPPARCEYALPGLGRCVDTSGTVHGHHFKPGQLDPDLVLTLEEARELTEYMRYLYWGPDSVLTNMLTRLAAHVRVTA